MEHRQHPASASSPVVKFSWGANWDGIKVEENVLVGTTSQAFERDCGWLLLSAINALEQDNERLRVINYLLKVEYKTLISRSKRA